MNEMQRPVIFVIGMYKNGGVARRSTTLANEMGQRGRKVILLATKEIGDELYFKLHENVSLVPLAAYSLAHQNDRIVKRDRTHRHLLRHIKKLQLRLCPAKKRENIEYQIKWMRKSEALRCFLLQHQNAVLIPFGIDCYELTNAATSGLHNKIIFAERNAPQVETAGSAARLAQAGALLDHAAACVFQTKDELRYYQDYLHHAKSYVIHNPVGDTLPAPYFGQRQKTIINFCRIAEQKNLPLLLDAFALLNRDYPEYRLRIWGNAVVPEEEALRDHLIAKIKQMGLSEIAEILPPRADVHLLVRDCAMFVSSSDFEGLSNSMLEAMAIGLPVVCTDCAGGGARELIENGENGLLVPVKNADALYHAMKQIIDHPELAEKCGRNAAKQATLLSIEAITDQWLDAIFASQKNYEFRDRTNEN